MPTVDVPDIPRTDRLDLDPARSAVVVVDMQNDFVKEGGALRVADAEATLPAIARLLARAREAGAHVLYTQDWHPEDDPEFEIWPRHVVAGTWGAEIVAELAPQEDEWVLQKPRYDGFYGTRLEHQLRLWGVEHVIVVGTVANICVLHTAGSAALRWFDVIVPEDGVSALTEFDRLATLRQVTFLYLGEVTTVDGIAFT